MNKNSLSELFSIEDQEAMAQPRRTLLFDGHNLAYRTLFSAIFMSPDDNDKFFFWRHLFMNSFFSTIDRFNPERVVLAFDNTKNGCWRHEHFDGYKSKRKSARDGAVVDFGKFFPVFNEFIKDIKETFKTIYVMDIPHSEADDIIAILCREKFQSTENIIVSTDKDLYQLMIEKNNKQFDPIKNKMSVCVNPKKALDLKIIAGDKSDCIPAIKPRTGPATAEAILRNGLDKYLEEEGKEVKENYIRNRILIDFDFIPKDLSSEIINTYCNYDITDLDGAKLMKFFTKHKLNKMMDNWTNYSPLIKSLK